jgi:hypothetical protein
MNYQQFKETDGILYSKKLIQKQIHEAIIKAGYQINIDQIELKFNKNGELSSNFPFIIYKQLQAEQELL